MIGGIGAAVINTLREVLQWILAKLSASSMRGPNESQPSETAPQSQSGHQPTSHAQPKCPLAWRGWHVTAPWEQNACLRSCVKTSYVWEGPVSFDKEPPSKLPIRGFHTHKNRRAALEYVWPYLAPFSMPDFNHPDPYGIGGPVTYEHEDPVYGRLIEIRYEGRAIGQVELYGQIIEGEWGYQAQGAIVRSIYVLKTTPACIVAQLEERYQCEVGLLEPHSFEEVSSDAVDRHEATP